MKELEKTKNISIVSIVFILVVLVALLTYKKPKHLYEFNTATTLEKLANADYYTTLETINKESSAIIDIRNQFEFDKGHITGAINMYSPEILNEKNTAILNSLKKDSKEIILYGTSVNEAMIPYTILYQLGFTNLKIAKINLSYHQNTLITENSTFENLENNSANFIEESVKKASVITKPKVEVKITPPKKVITIEKKKKAPTEGGC